MTPTLQILWDSAQPSSSASAAKEKMQKLIPLQDKIQTQFGLEFLDQWDRAWDDLHLSELDCAFEQGFLAAFRLWMEVSAMGHGM